MGNKITVTSDRTKTINEHGFEDETIEIDADFDESISPETVQELLKAIADTAIYELENIKGDI